MNSAAAAWSHQSLLADCAPPYLRTATAPHSRGPRGVRTRRGGYPRIPWAGWPFAPRFGGNSGTTDKRSRP